MTDRTEILTPKAVIGTNAWAAHCTARRCGAAMWEGIYRTFIQERREAAGWKIKEAV